MTLFGRYGCLSHSIDPVILTAGKKCDNYGTSRQIVNMIQSEVCYLVSLIIMYSDDRSSHCYICFVVIVGACCHASGNNRITEEMKATV